MAGGEGGGWMGSERSLGGLPRTYGLQNRKLSEEDNVPIQKRKLQRAASYFLPYWRQWLLILLCLAVTAGLGVLPPLAIRALLDQAIPHRDVRLVLLLSASIVVLGVGIGLVGVLQSYLNSVVSEGIIFDLRTRLYRHLQEMSLTFYTGTRAGEIISRITNDIGAVQNTVANTLVTIVGNLFTVLATVITLFAMSPSLAVLSIVVVPGLYLPTRLVGRVRRRLSQEVQEAHAENVAFLQERLNIGGMLLTKIFGQGPADAAGYTERSRHLMGLNIRAALAGRWLFMALSVFAVAGPAIIYAQGGFQTIQGEITVGTVIAFVSLLSNLYRPLTNLASVYVDIQAALGVFQRIFEFLDLEPEVIDRPNARTLAVAQGEVRFEDVRFAYPTAKTEGARFALDDISFTIHPGEQVALVGPSGAGKTTITYLLPRLLDPTEGRITLDGHDLRDLTMASLREQIGMVTQETYLFHTTIRENLLYARPDATEEEMIAATRSANIHDLIAGLPDGYDTVVGERAFRLSGGERQRLSIARALLKDPRLLILDEATSSLDANSEYLIQQALDRLLQGRTSLIIAHRLSTIRNANKILVLNQGRLVEQGTHEELLEHGGLYATLYHQQLRRAEELFPEPPAAAIATSR